MLVRHDDAPFDGIPFVVLAVIDHVAMSVSPLWKFLSLSLSSTSISVSYAMICFKAKLMEFMAFGRVDFIKRAG